MGDNVIYLWGVGKGLSLRLLGGLVVGLEGRSSGLVLPATFLR